MSGVDDRIVSMKFDNGGFESKLGDTLKSLDKLRASLDFANSTRNLNQLTDAGKNFSLAGMSHAIEGVSTKFIALTTIGITALATLTQKAVTAGLEMAKSLTIKPVMEGFKEYETNMNSIQTILSNTDAKGTTLDDVSAALDKLNLYSDQTIYNFSQMAKNIGTFTAAGVDLDTSVNSIKGIANLAAISGSNADQASTAMYQLSQAMASGTVKLMDWNSVVNAGMGGEVFQKALFESGKAAKTLEGVPLDQTFEEWKKAGNSFRGSLESGWLTGEVLTNTLQGFTGDLTEAQILSMGYTKEQAVEIMRLGKLGKAAATEVKTLTQLFSTVKESVASGWSSTFKLVVGDFNEAKELFTSIANGVGAFVGKSADARNNMLKIWKEMGGRDQLIQGFENALGALLRVLAPIQDAFREIFPPMTAIRLLALTQAFSNFFLKLQVGRETVDKIKRTFAGIFAVVEIGWTILKGIIGLIGTVLSSLGGAGGGVLSFFANIGDGLVGLNKALVEGGGIKKFFEGVGAAISVPLKFISQLVSSFKSFSKSVPGMDGITPVLGGIQGSVQSLTRVTDRFGNAWGRLGSIFEGVSAVLDKAWAHLSGWFSSLGSKLAEAFRPGDFNAAVDIVNVGLFGGILLLLKKFVKNGFKLDLTGGIFEKAGKALDTFTDKTKAMTTNIKADTLMKIAIAVGILTISIIALALVDSVALTRALTAMAVGFGELIVVMNLLSGLTQGPMGAIKIGILAGALILLAAAMVIMSIAIKNLASLSFGELVKGLIGISVGLGALVIAVNLISANPAGIIRAGLSMLVIAGALWVLSKAVKSFAEMGWTEMAKGLIGVAVGLGIIVTAMSFMPPGLFVAGAGIILIAVGLNILAIAVKSFSDMGWAEMGKGLLGIAGGLVVIAAAMWIMPPHMILMAAGLLVLSVALNVMALAIKTLGGMKLSEITKGVGSLAGMLAVLAAAMIVMTGTLAGAAALVVAAGALVILTAVLKVLGGMSIREIVAGLAAMAGVFLILGAAALLLGPLIPVLFSLGAAMALIGGAFALFGTGVMFVAKAFEILAKAGRVGISVLLDAIRMLLTALPELVTAVVKSVVQLATELLSAAPLLVRLITAVLLQLLETIITLTPKIGEALKAIVVTGLMLIRELFPDMLKTGLDLLIELLKGIRDNIGEIATLGIEIVVKLANTLVENAFKIVEAAIKLVFAFLQGIQDRALDIVRGGINLILAFIRGIAENIFKIVETAASIVVAFIEGVASNIDDVVTAGADAMVAFLYGIGSDINRVVTAGVDLVLALIDGLTDNAVRFANASATMIIDFLNALAEVIRVKTPDLIKAGRNIAGAIVDGMLAGLKDTPVIGKALELANGIINGVKGVFGIKSPSKVFTGIAKNLVKAVAIVFDNDSVAQNSAVQQAERIVKAFEATLTNMPDPLLGMGELSPVITPVLDLTKVKAEARTLDSLMAASTITPDVSYQNARLISTTSDLESDGSDSPAYSGPTEVKFEQNIYAPTALSTNDIYRSTKSQIVLAKEELSIP